MSMSIDWKGMKLKKLPDAIFQKIECALTACAERNQRPIAAFDADGTLWKTDLGESFFKYQIEQKLLSNLPDRPWEHYRQMKSSGDPRPAYLWLAQINRGVSLKTVQAWSQDCLDQMKPLPIFPEQAHLIDFLQKQNVEIYIVTASVKWAVEPGALELGIPRENVIGVSTKVLNGLISEEAHGAITYREGKSAAFLQATHNQVPFLSCGNSIGDEHLLKIASDIKLAVRSEDPESELFSSEELLEQKAVEQKWLHVRL